MGRPVMWASLPSGQLQRLQLGREGVLVLSGARSPRPVQAGAEGPAAWGGAAAGARGAGGRWQSAVVRRPAREALEAAGVRRCAQSSQLHDAEFGGQALGGLENSGLAGGRQAGVLLACGAAGRGGCASTLAEESLARGREPCGARCAADGPVPRSGGVLLEERGT